MKVKSFLKSIDQKAIVAYTDSAGIIRYVNDNFCDISGFPREELVGNTHRIINSGYHPRKFFKSMWESIQDGQVWMGEVCNRKKTGELYWVNTTISPEFDDHGELVGFYAIRYDITKEKILEEQNLELLRISDSIQEMAIIGGWEYDFQKEKVVWTNQTYKIHEVPEGINISLELAIEFYVESDRDKIKGVLGKCIEFGTPWDEYYQIITAKGRMVWVRSTGEAVYERDGSIKKLRGTFQDVTDKKENEIKAENERKLFLHNAKLTTLGEMASSMIHEISNPLTVIKGVLDSSKKKENLDDMRRLVLKADEPLKRLLKMVSNLRQFSRNETINREVKENDLQDIIHTSIEYTRYKFRRNQVPIKILNEKPFPLFCERNEMEQVFVNILNNAVDAIENHEERWVEIDYENVIGKGCTITITDSGDGIPKAVVDNIFDSFYTTKAKEKGTGIGLGVVSDIITEHGAKIFVDKKHKNTRFVIFFPEKALQQHAG
ncbi:MAG: PAS domain-containing protein [Halobacteriovoraceae bacterium]|nr:PAS domain-containing protein [Halobacteriovoraceae bacterium]